MYATRTPPMKLPAAATTASAWTSYCAPTNFLKGGFTSTSLAIVYHQRLLRCKKNFVSRLLVPAEQEQHLFYSCSCLVFMHHYVLLWQKTADGSLSRNLTITTATTGAG